MWEKGLIMSKKSFRDYKSEVRSAYRIGYSNGWSDYDSIAKSKGSRFMAARGYGRGLSAHHKHYKNLKRKDD